MLTFKQFANEEYLEKLHEEICSFGFTDSQIEEFSSERHLQERKESLATHHAPVPHAEQTMSDRAKSAHLWHSLKGGAHEYFNAPAHEQAAIHHEANKIKPHSLFTDEASNPKLAKNGDKMPEYHTKGVFLAPAKSSGTDVCPASTPECRASCLGPHSGRGKMKNTQKSRIDKTHFMINHPKHFYAKLDHEITAAKTSAAKKGQKLAVRLNGTSDIPHEHMAPQLFAKHHDVQFYDYTKVTGRAHNAAMPKNYHLTTSSSGLNHPDSNWKSVRKHLDKGGVASMVFRVKQGRKGGVNKNGITRKGTPEGALPTHVHDEETGKKYRVIDGDVHDHRHLDHAYNNVPHGEGVIAGLRLKGTNKKGTGTGATAGSFAVHVPHGETHVVARKGEN